MTIQVTKSKLIENIYRNFFDIVRASDSIFTNIIYAAMPDFELTKVNSYPIIILNDPKLKSEQKTMEKSKNGGVIIFEVYTTDAKLTAQYADKLIDAIEINKGTLADNGIHEVFNGETNGDTIPYGKVKVHIKFIPFTFVVYTSKTHAY